MDDTDFLKPHVTYSRITESFLIGMMGVWKARIVSNTIAILVLGYRKSPGEITEITSASPVAELLDELEKVSLDEYLGYQNVTDASHFVYTMALFDSFLSDTTKFLLIFKPEGLGQECRVPLSAILAAKSRSAVITAEAERRVKKLGFQSFPTRIEFLEKRFGLCLNLQAELLSLLERFASERNALVHDLGALSLSLSEKETMSLTQRSCPFHPARIERTDILRSAKTFLEVCSALHAQVMISILDAAKTPEFSRMCKIIDSLIASAQEDVNRPSDAA